MAQKLSTTSLAVVLVLAVTCGTAFASSKTHTTRTPGAQQRAQQQQLPHAPCHGLQSDHTTSTTAPLRGLGAGAGAGVALARRLLQKKYYLSPDVDHRNCYFYRAQDGDTLASIGEALGVPEAELKTLNAKTLQDLNKISGRMVQICNVKNFANAEGYKGTPAPAPAASTGNTPLAASGSSDKAGEKQGKEEAADAKAPAAASTTTTRASSQAPAATQQQGSGLNLPILGNALGGSRTGGIALPIGIGRH